MTRLLLLLCVCMLHFSCNKNNCEAASPVDIESNSPVVEGWDLQLKTIQNSGYTYKWYGPNGWSKEYAYNASDANEQTREALTLNDAGEYKVQMFNYEGCLVYEGKTMIEVTAAPKAPCTIPSNTSTSSVAGVGNYNFTNRSFGGLGSFYTVYASQGTAGGNQYMRFAFPDPAPPQPGVYTIASTTFGVDHGTVGLYIDAITHQFYAEPGRKVYVTRENGKLSLSFCSVPFSNPLNPAMPIIITANVTQP